VQKTLNDISAYSFHDEAKCIEELRNFIGDFSNVYLNAREIAEELVTKARAQSPRLFEALLQHYPLTSKEGRALMVLCEALPRIPDSTTQQELIRSVSSTAAWKSGQQGIIGVASNVAFGLVGRLAGMRTLRAISPLFQKTATAIIEKLARGFILTETIEAGIKESKKYEEKGLLLSYDMLGESARTEKQAKQYFKNYSDAIKKIGALHSTEKDWREKPGISIKLSALYHRYELLKKDEVFEHLLSKLTELVTEAARHNILLTIDAEDATRFDLYLEIFGAAFANPALEKYDGFGLALQAYQKRAFPAIDYLLAISKKYRRTIPIRLVKGAYWDTEIKSAQVAGLKNYPVFTAKENTDISYTACAKKILEHTENLYPQFATHNALTIAVVKEFAGEKKFELQKLHGMGDAIYEQLSDQIPCRIYAPIGLFNELLPYLVRRLLENGANNSFVHKMMSKDFDMAEILQNSINSNVANSVPQSANIYKYWQNSLGIDLGNIWELEGVKNKLRDFANGYWRAFSLIDGEKKIAATSQIIHEPANINRSIGDWSSANGNHIAEAIAVAEKGFQEWSTTTAEKRINCLEKLADLLEENKYELIQLCMREAGKTLADSIAEIREAADYCRYYAHQARGLLIVPQVLPGPVGEYNELHLAPRGIFLCISPWNFPLAIFLGQITAAIVTGNAVIAKPAEQVPLIAHFTALLIHKAGVPGNVMQLLLGSGEEIGAALVAQPKISGVVFTGSTETAKAINSVLATKTGPIVPLIAETGGQNAMVIDSSALLEQTADDIIKSAFGSSGQRCSSLRVAYIQEEIADELLELLCGILADFKIKDPIEFDTDYGPVIDSAAQKMLVSHVKEMRGKAKVIFDGEKVLLSENGWFVPPYIFEIGSIHELKQEVFGPILHIIRFKSTDLDKIINDINSTNFGLTIGIQTRIEARAEYIATCVNAGNCYVNRTQIGAVVGVQPFGGEKLSGTGPKAGGPYYLLRFLTERTYTVNTAAIGGDANLLNMS